jgi:hypothetical protein
MSVVKLSFLKLHWRKMMRKELVAKRCSRTNFSRSCPVSQPVRQHLSASCYLSLHEWLYKVHDFLNNMATNFDYYIAIEEIISFDEQMIPFKGQLEFKVTGRLSHLLGIKDGKFSISTLW